ncbi:hypothetical protein D3C86_1990230 [compost metagenome]
MLTGNEKGTWLYVDGKLVQKMEGKKISFEKTDGKISRMQTLVFPLGQPEGNKKGAQQLISNLKVYNKRLNESMISELP